MTIQTNAQNVISQLSARGLMIRCAESCTGGMIMAALTDVSGASAVVDRGFVTYSNNAKQEMLGVAEDTLNIYGAVSAETAYEMVTGAMVAPNTAAISVTGVAGPNGGSAEKPVGIVWIGAAIPDNQPLISHYLFAGDRQSVREQTVAASLTQLLSLLD